MELYQIRYFLVLSRTLNFTQAAEECNVTQPALTRAIKKLEEELGGDLFRRERAKSHVTELGKAMLPLLQQSFDAAFAAKTEAENFGRGEVAPLRVGISETITSALFERVFDELQRAVSGLNLKLLRRPAVEILDLLQVGDVDFGVVAECDDLIRDRIRSWLLFEEDFVFCGENEGGGAIPLTDLNERPFVARPYCETSNAIRSQLESLDIHPEQLHIVDCDADLSSVVGLAGAGAFVPRSSAEHLHLDWRDLEGGAFRRSVVVIEQAGRQHNAAASRFLRLIRSADLP